MKVRTDRVGEVRKMNSGHVCRIINYNTAKDIDVQFDDGTIREHVHYISFLRGEISKDNVRGSQKSYELGRSRIGLKRLMNCGLYCEVIEYRTGKDMDVLFEDGLVKEHVRWDKFMDGGIQHPDYKVIQASQRRSSSEKLGERKLMNCGMEAEIIAYRSAKDIDVRFSNGVVRSNVKYVAFKDGEVRPVSLEYTYGSIIGERKVMNCGMLAEIVSAESLTNICVRFIDGTVVSNKTYRNFKKGSIGYPSSGYFGSEKYVNGNLYSKVIRSSNCKDIDIQYYDGRIALHSTLDTFEGGGSAKPKHVLIPAYTYKGVQYYTYEYRGRRYLGTYKEILSEVSEYKSRVMRNDDVVL